LTLPLPPARSSPLAERVAEAPCSLPSSLDESAFPAGFMRHLKKNGELFSGSMVQSLALFRKKTVKGIFFVQRTLFSGMVALLFEEAPFTP
jgi:hypothetical protein